MMTNRFNLPAPIVAAVERFAAKYDKGGADISATQLGEAPRVIALKNRHGEEIQEDVSDRLYALDGHIVHEILEQAATIPTWGAMIDPPQGHIPEEEMQFLPMKYYRRADPPNLGSSLIVEKRFRATFKGWVVSGQVDLFDPTTGIISDYKRVSVAEKKRGVKDTWVWQLNVLAELLRRNGHQVTGVEAIRWYRDWSRSALQRETDYPPCAIETIKLPLWTAEEATKWIEDRVEIHQLAAMVADDDELPMCSDKERYNDGPTFAVMKAGKDRALRVLPTEPEAALWLAQHPGNGLSIVARQGANKKCQLYCNVWQFCALGRKEHSEARVTEEVAIS